MAPYAVLLVVGLGVFASVFSADQFVFHGPSSAAGVRLPGAIDPVFVKQGGQWPILSALAVAMSTSMITVTLFELVKTLVQYGLWWRSKRNQLDAFFGEGAVKHSAAAQVIVQSDQLSVVLEGLLDTDSELEKRPRNRLYKARQWVNRFDAEGGRQIIKLFRDEGLAPPDFDWVERNSKSKPEAIPFKVLLGLGMSDQVIDGDFTSWLRVVISSKGDAIRIRRSLLPGDWESRLDVDPSDSTAEFVTLWPRQWTLDGWLGESREVRDYAVILRHTLEGRGSSKPCVLFWLAGFTERGTTAAGRHLAENWQSLYTRFASRASQGLGDFMIMIEGRSHGASEQWSEVDAFEVTPSKLDNKGIDTSWARRLKALR